LNGNHAAVHGGRLTRAAGGKSDPNNKLWELLYKEAVALGLESRIVKGKPENVKY
jgi:hypothetical protein